MSIEANAINPINPEQWRIIGYLDCGCPYYQQLRNGPEGKEPTGNIIIMHTCRLVDPYDPETLLRTVDWTKGGDVY